VREHRDQLTAVMVSFPLELADACACDSEVELPSDGISRDTDGLSRHAHLCAEALDQSVLAASAQIGDRVA